MFLADGGGKGISSTLIDSLDTLAVIGNIKGPSADILTHHTSRHTSHVTRHTSHVTRHTSQVLLLLSTSASTAATSQVQAPPLHKTNKP